MSEEEEDEEEEPRDEAMNKAQLARNTGTMQGPIPLVAGDKKGPAGKKPSVPVPSPLLSALAAE